MELVVCCCYAHVRNTSVVVFWHRSQAAEDYLRRGLLQSSTSCAKTYSMNILTRRRLELMKTSLRVALKTEPRTILMIS
jgi:nucleoid-associated protein YejK